MFGKKHNPEESEERMFLRIILEQARAIVNLSKEHGSESAALTSEYFTVTESGDIQIINSNKNITIFFE